MPVTASIGIALEL